MTDSRITICVTVLAFLSACDSDTTEPSDAGSSDAGTVDIGSADAGSPDALTPDAHVEPPMTDAGPAPDPGLFSMDELELVGAFRVSSDEHGESNSNYAVGTLGYHAGHDSLFLAGHAHHNAVAEFEVPDRLGMASTVGELPLVEPRQEFRTLLGRSANGNPDGMDRITGLYVSDGHLIVQANRWYDASGRAVDTSLLVVNSDLNGTVIGYFELDGAARSAGFISPIPPEWQDRLGGPALAGWASNYSIVSRYSVGPTLFAFDPSLITSRSTDATAEGRVPTRAWMDFAYGEGVFMAPDALEQQCEITDEVTSCEPGASASPVWNHLSRAMYGFIVPGTRTYAVFGRTGGTTTGIGYKIRQDNDNLCGGYCAYGSDDYTNYYWLFDLEDLLAAAAPSDPRPYDYGAWSIPFDDNGSHSITGGAWDPDRRRLYLSLGGAGQVGTYDRPPLIVAYQLEGTG